MPSRSTKKDIEVGRPEYGRLIGYARVSTKQQSLSMQIQFLKEAGVHEDDIYQEKMSGRTKDRTQLKRALQAIRSGDTFVVYKLDRLGRDLPEVIKRLDWFAKEDIKFKSITEGIEINLSDCKPAERLQVHMLASLAQFEVDLDRERTSDGVQRAKERGVKFGAKEKISDKQVVRAIKMRDQGKSLKQVAVKFKVSQQTILRRIKKYVKENP